MTGFRQKHTGCVLAASLQLFTETLTRKNVVPETATICDAKHWLRGKLLASCTKMWSKIITKKPRLRLLTRCLHPYSLLHRFLSDHISLSYPRDWTLCGHFSVCRKVTFLFFLPTKTQRNRNCLEWHPENETTQGQGAGCCTDEGLSGTTQRITI